MENDDLLSARWRVTKLEVDGVEVEVSDVFVELSTAQTSLRVDSNCHGLYGSFTIETSDAAENIGAAEDSGDASFTVPGASTNQCSPDDQQIEDALLLALESTSSWRQEGPKLLFQGDSTLLELSPVD